MKGKVFILEDDTSICGLIKVALEMNGLEFKAFSTLKSFIDALNKEQPDVALLDIMLPDGSGLDALKYIKEKYPSVSCIMLSALSKEEDKVNGLNLGADDYIAKPFSDGKEVSLNHKEFELLKYFMENHGKVLSREKLLTEVWGYDVGETRTLDNHVARLRKLGVKIETVFGVGYKL